MRPSLSLLLLLGLGGSVAVAQDGSLYEGEVPVHGQDAAERASALPAALAQVLTKVSGSMEVITDAALLQNVAQAGELMQQYRYRRDVVPGAAAPQTRLYLIARFNRASVDAMLTNAGYPIWGEPRATPVVWLAIDDGSGARLLGSEQVGAVRALTHRAGQRGVKLVFPLLDLEDQRRVEVATVRSHDVQALAAPSRRYRSPVLLVGTLSRGAGSWSSEWVLADRGEELLRFRDRNADPAVLLRSAADAAADALATRYARRGGSGAPGRYTIWVEGIHDGVDYARLVAYLGGLPMVQAVQPQLASGERLQLVLDMSTGLEGLDRQIGLGDTLETPGPAADVAEPLTVEQPGTDPAPVYRLRP